MGIVDFSALGGGDVEGVHRDAFFGADAGVGGVEAVVVDRVEKVVEEADAVECLDLERGAAWVEFVADECADGDRDVLIGAVLEEICATAQVAFGFVLG